MRSYLANLWLALTGQAATRFAALEARVAQADRRAAAQRKSRAERAKPATESEGVTPLAPQSAAQE